MLFSSFVDYARQQRDEAPLYVFDCRFGEKVPALAAAYTAPPYFSGKFIPHSTLIQPSFSALLLRQVSARARVRTSAQGRTAVGA